MSDRARSKFQSALTVWLLVVMFISPLPIGGNLPTAWCVFALAIAVTGLVYGLGIIYLGAQFPMRIGKLGIVAIPWLVFCSFSLAQSLPLGGLMPIFLTSTAKVLISPTLSLAPGQTLLVSIQLLAYGLMFYLFAQFSRRPGRALLILQVIFWIDVFYALFAIVELTQWGDTLMGIPKWTYFGSATGTFVNRNTFATFLALGLVLGMALLAEAAMAGSRSDSPRRWNMSSAALLVAGEIAILASLMATQSRMGAFAGIVGTMAVAILWAWKAKSGRVAIATFLTLAAGGAIAFLYGGGLADRLGSAESSFDVRLDLYRQVFQMIVARPWVGYGAGSFEIAYPLFHTPPVSVDLVWDKSHSTYLALWSEFGVLAGSIPMLLIVFILWRLVATYWARAEVSASVLGGIGVVVVVGLHSTVDFSMEIQAVAVLFLAIFAVGCSQTVPPSERQGETARVSSRRSGGSLH